MAVISRLGEAWGMVLKVKGLRKVSAALASLGSEGATLVEFALSVPILLLFVIGIIQFGFSLNQYLMLTNAVATGAQLFSISRASTTTPYTSTVSAIQAAAPNLATASLTITLSVNGTACTTDAACQTALNNNATNPATVTATYPCSALYTFVPGCTLASQVTEFIQ
jgi:Flp pilus assembly protein TadG